MTRSDRWQRSILCSNATQRPTSGVKYWKIVMRKQSKRKCNENVQKTEDGIGSDGHYAVTWFGRTYQ